MTKKEVEGFLSNPFFAALTNPKEVDEETIKSTFKDAFECDSRENDYIYRHILEDYFSIAKISQTDFNSINFRNNYIPIVKQVLLEYLLQEDALKYFCYDDEYEKIIQLIERKQITSKIVVSSLNRISYVIQRFSNQTSTLSLILYSNIKSHITKFDNDHIVKTMGPLKKIIDKIASGVKSQCYIDFEHILYVHKLQEELVDYVKEKYGYDLNNHEYIHYGVKTIISKVLSMAVVNDDSFWVFNDVGRDKSIITFVSLVYKYNDLAHATKIIDYAFKEACKDKKIKFLCDNHLPFFLYDIEENMINWSLNRLSVYLSDYVDFKITNEELNGFIYPLYDGYEDNIQTGEKVFKSFLKDVYPDDYKKAFDEFTKIDNVIQESKIINPRKTARELSVRDIVDYHVLGYDNVEEKKKYLNLVNKEFLNDESVLKRLYYRIYIINKYSKDETFRYLYEYLYEVLKKIEVKFNLRSSYVMDTELRDNSYALVKKILSNYNLNIDDKYKELYVTALLDRKYATAEEASKFAELEQFGDAIYELAVDNIIFYDPEYKKSLDHNERTNYVKADSQVLISKKIGLDKAYISRLNNSLNTKYDAYELYDNGLDNSFNGHYLADSLEMVIGAVAKEFNIQTALDFATKVILETFDELKEPVIFKNFDIVKLSNDSNIDKDYLNKIYPSPFLEENDYYMEYSQLQYALNKILKIAIIGNDTVEKRNMIAADINKLIPNEDYRSYYQVVVCYLYYGIEETINKYRSLVESNYKQAMN